MSDKSMVRVLQENKRLKQAHLKLTSELFRAQEWQKMYEVLKEQYLQLEQDYYAALGVLQQMKRDADETIYYITEKGLKWLEESNGSL